VQNTAQPQQGHTIEGQAQPVQEPQRKD